MRAPLAVLVLTVVLAAVPDVAAGQTQPGVTVGLSDQQAWTLDEPLVGWLGFRHARVIAPWDVALHRSEAFERWLRAAYFAGFEPLVSFQRSGPDCREGPCRLPSAEEYRAAFAAFRARWPHIANVSVWNEANHPGQPTAQRPDAAAAYYAAAASVCPGCRILASEVVDIGGMTSWVGRFERALGRRAPLWGLHNYGDVTRLRDSSTVALLAAVQGEVWITETGGLVRFSPGGRVRWPEDEARARAAVEFGLALADAHAARIGRVYLYNWREAPTSRWDSGLLAPDGRVRPSFWVVAARLRPATPPPRELLPPGTTPRPEAPGAPATRGPGVRARVTRRPRFAHGRVRARVACPLAPARRCHAALVLRTHPARARGGGRRTRRDGRSRLGRDAALIAPGRARVLSVRVPRSRLRLIRAGRTRSLLAEIRIRGQGSVRYRVRCGRRR